MNKIRTITPQPPADFTPSLGNYTSLSPFRFWCQKVLPLVYDDSLSYYELLCKIVDYLNKTMEDVETLHGDVVNLHQAYVELQNWVNSYFDSLDVQQEIDKKLDEMAEDGTLQAIIAKIINANGQPTIVTNISEMSNQNKIYVLESTGEIYYYKNGSFQQSGLIYGNTPFGLKIFPHMLTKDNYSQYLNDLNDCESNTVYNIYWLQNPTNPDHMPDTQSGVYTIYNINTTAGKTAGDVQYCEFISVTGTPMIRYFKRVFGGGTNWGEWVEQSEDNLLTFKSFKNIITSANFNTQLTDLNAAKTNKAYIVYITNSNMPANMPSSNPGSYLVLNFNHETRWLANDVQICFYTDYANDYSLKMFCRFCTGQAPTFSDWVNMDTDNLIRVNSSNYVSVLPDLNSSKTHVNYIINVGKAGESPLNMPSQSTGVYYLMNVNQKTSWNESDVQICFKIPAQIPQTTFDIYMRLAGSSNTFSEWAFIGGGNSGKGGTAGATESFSVTTNNVMYEGSTSYNTPNYNKQQQSSLVMVSFPSTYQKDKPNKWCMVFHGAGKNITDWIKEPTYLNIHNALLNNGFCVVLFNGFSDSVYDSWGSFKGTFAVSKIAEECRRRFNLENEFVAYGFSMGGLNLLNYLRNGGGGCKGAAVGSPVINLKKVFDNNPSALEPVYGFNGTYNLEKVIGCDPVGSLIDNGTTYVGGCVPIFGFYGSNETSGYLDNVECGNYFKSLQKSGVCAYYRIYTGGHEVCYGGNQNAIDQMVWFLSGF